MNQKFLTFILVLGILSLIPAAFAADTLIRNTTGDLEISTKTTDGGGVHIRSRQTGTGLFIDTANKVGIGDSSPLSLLTVGTADAFQVNSSGVVGAGTWQGTAITDTYVSDTLTIGASGSISDSAFSANVSLLGTAVEKGEIANSGTLSFDWADSEVSNTLTASAVPWSGVSSKPTLPSSQEGSRYTTDFNTILSTGFFNAEATPPNSPGGSYGQLIVARGIDTGLQIYGGYNNDQLWFRGWWTSGAGFGAWRKVWHDGNDGAASGLDADLLDGSSSATYLDNTDFCSGGTCGTITAGTWNGTALTNAYVSDTITVGASGSVNDAALSANVSTLGSSISTGEIVDGTIQEVDLEATAAPTDNYILSYDLATLGFTWVVDANSGGDITGVTAGNQLTGGGTSGTVTLNVSEGAGSGLDADLLDGISSASFSQGAHTTNTTCNGISCAVTNTGTLDGYSAVEASTVSTIAVRNASGDINARLFRSEYDSTNATINYIMTQIDTVSNNYMRPSTPAQLISALNLSTGSHATNTTCNGISCAVTNTGTLDGYSVSTTRNSANTIPVRDATGYLQLGWINTTSGSAGTTAPDRIYGSYDPYLRYYTPANFANVMTSSFEAYFLRSNVDDNLSAAIIVPSANRDEGIFGTYDSYKTQHIWSMGTAYRNNAAGTNFGNLYGLAYKHTNNTTGGTMAGGHQMVWAQNGVGTSAMGTGIWTSGTVTANKANVNTVDPIYTIGGTHYATYMAGMTGLKEETTGIIRLSSQYSVDGIQYNGDTKYEIPNTTYSYTIDFSVASEGSDLWLFAQTINIDGRAYIAEDGTVYRTTAEELFDNFSVLLTPNFAGDVWYEKDVENKLITIFGSPTSENPTSQTLEVSYRLTAPRFDWKSWSNYSSDDYEGLNLDKLLSSKQ